MKMDSNNKKMAKVASKFCPEGHPFPNQKTLTSRCLVKMLKMLPCGHEVCIIMLSMFTLNKLKPSWYDAHQMEVDCWQPPQEAFCSVRVEKFLNDCQHTAFLPCGKSTEGFKCPLTCEKQLCADGHLCNKLCWQSCGVCKTPIVRQLGCGHQVLLQCHLDPLKIKCTKPKQVVLPGCGHKLEIECGVNPEDANCNNPCDIRLDCGHCCTQPLVHQTPSIISSIFNKTFHFHLKDVTWRTIQRTTTTSARNRAGGQRPTAVQPTDAEKSVLKNAIDAASRWTAFYPATIQPLPTVVSKLKTSLAGINIFTYYNITTHFL